MRLLIISFFLSAVCFGQTNVTGKNVNTGTLNGNSVIGDTNQFIPTGEKPSPIPKLTSGKLSSADSLLIPVFSTKDVYDYLNRIEKVAASIKNLRLPNDQEYAQLIAEMNLIIIEMDKKRKGIK